MDEEEEVMVRMVALFSSAMSFSGSVANSAGDVIRRANTFKNWLVKELEDLGEK